MLAGPFRVPGGVVGLVRPELEVGHDPPRAVLVRVRAQVERRDHRPVAAGEEPGVDGLVEPDGGERGGHVRGGPRLAEQEQPHQRGERGARADRPGGRFRLPAVQRRARVRPERGRDALDGEARLAEGGGEAGGERGQSVEARSGPGGGGHVDHGDSVGQSARDRFTAFRTRVTCGTASHRGNSPSDERGPCRADRGKVA